MGWPSQKRTGTQLHSMQSRQPLQQQHRHGRRRRGQSVLQGHGGRQGACLQRQLTRVASECPHAYVMPQLSLDLGGPPTLLQKDHASLLPVQQMQFAAAALHRRSLLLLFVWRPRSLGSPAAGQHSPRCVHCLVPPACHPVRHQLTPAAVCRQSLRGGQARPQLGGSGAGQLQGPALWWTMGQALPQSASSCQPLPLTGMATAWASPWIPMVGLVSSPIAG